jgi:hypothetical protein
MNEAKFFADSKTLLLALLVAIAGLSDVIAPYTVQLQEMLGAHWFTWLMLIISFATAIIRQYTAGGLTFKKPPALIPPTNGDPK